MTFVPASLASLTAAIVVVFGYEFLCLSFIVRFGENQFDYASSRGRKVAPA